MDWSCLGKRSTSELSPSTSHAFACEGHFMVNVSGHSVCGSQQWQSQRLRLVRILSSVPSTSAGSRFTLGGHHPWPKARVHINHAQLTCDLFGSWSVWSAAPDGHHRPSKKTIFYFLMVSNLYAIKISHHFFLQSISFLLIQDEHPFIDLLISWPIIIWTSHIS